MFPLLREALALTAEIGDQLGGCYALVVTAGLGSVVGEWVYAARLNAAAEAHLGQSGLQRDGIDEVFIRPLVTEAREALGEPAFAEAVRGGRALSYEEAMAEARGWLESRL